MATNKPIPFQATHPGAILRREIEDRNISDKQLSLHTGISLPLLSAFLQKEILLEQAWPALFERELGIPADFWLRLQENYLIDLKRIAQRDRQQQQQQHAQHDQRAEQATHYALPHSWNNVTGQNIAFS